MLAINILLRQFTPMLRYTRFYRILSLTCTLAARNLYLLGSALVL